ncbi:hypothetical protein FOA52_012601 [Chlamydomonas sp. UWO 241]|nr:hypothetical protein FOA52_012601 [Chlamydomonas sp. UWO 241]
MLGARAGAAASNNAAISRRKKEAAAAADEPENEEQDDEEKPLNDWVHRYTRKLPPQAFLPLFSVLVIAMLLAVMLPVYFSFVAANAIQDEARVWPLDTVLDEMDQIDQFIVELDLTAVDPETRTASFLFDLSLGGVYEHDTDSGVLDLKDGFTLSVKLGHQSLSYDSGDSVSDQFLDFVIDDISPLFNYPFDAYTLTMEIYCSEVNETDTSNIVSERVPTGVILYEGEQGWTTSAKLTALTFENGTERYGTKVVISIVRADSVKFFSMFIVILMWVISLGMLAIALNYVLSKSLELYYDVPGLAIALLFALPFVRDVQPSIPTVGITIDILGFFFNMILIAIATVMVMAALSARHHKVEHLKARAATDRGMRTEAQRMAMQMEEGNSAPLRHTEKSMAIDVECAPSNEQLIKANQEAPEPREPEPEQREPELEPLEPESEPRGSGAFDVERAPLTEQLMIIKANQVAPEPRELEPEPREPELEPRERLMNQQR